MRVEPDEGVGVQIAAGVITYYGVKNAKDAIEAEGGKFTASDIFTNATFRCVEAFASCLSIYSTRSIDGRGGGAAEPASRR